VEEKKSEILERSPNRLLTNFSKGYLWFGILVTIVVHVVFVGGTSVQYIKDTYIDPEGAKLRKEQAVREQQERAQKVEDDKKKLAAGNTNAVAGATNAPAGGAAAPAAGKTESAKAGGGADTLAGLTEEQKASLEVKKLTEVAKPGELPRLDDIPQ
jgi:hypothetical protein